MKRIGALTALPLIVACSSSLSSPDGGAAGTGSAAGTGGTSSTAGTGGAGRGGSEAIGGRGGSSGGNDGGVPQTIPCCVASLMAACQTDGACVRAAGDAGDGARTCYASGVKVISSAVPPPQSFEECLARPDGFCQRSLTEVYKPDGSLCYSKEIASYCGQGCEVTFETWRTGAGAIVAQASYSSLGVTPLSCVRTGDASTSEPDSGVICLSPPPGPACTDGSCL
jgi:hypothetical protein